MTPVSEARKKIRHLIDDASPIESPVAYYALFHPAERSALFVDEQGFVGRFQTGIDLFRPLVTLKCQTVQTAADLLSQALVVGRPYILFTALNQLPMIGGSLQVENQRILRIFTVDPTRFKPIVNVMVQERKSPDGTPRCVVEVNGQVMTSAGVNWKSPGFAELYVYTEPQARQKGWGRSVVACMTERLLKEGIRPVYLVENDNDASLELIEGLGFYDTGSRQVYADTTYVGNPNR